MKPHIEITITRNGETVASWDNALADDLGNLKEPNDIATQAAPHFNNGDSIKVLRHNGTRARTSTWLIVDNGHKTSGVVTIEKTHPMG